MLLSYARASRDAYHWQWYGMQFCSLSLPCSSAGDVLLRVARGWEATCRNFCVCGWSTPYVSELTAEFWLCHPNTGTTVLSSMLTERRMCCEGWQWFYRILLGWTHMRNLLGEMPAPALAYWKSGRRDGMEWNGWYLLQERLIVDKHCSKIYLSR